MSNRTRIGIGYDVHPLVEGRKLVLGGVEIPFNKGLNGWSDADVLVHAVMDALLGAAALGDIGTHFPPGDPQYKGVSSIILLGKVKDLVQDAGWRIGNIDVMILAEAPRLKEYMDSMTRNIAEALNMAPGDISLKAGTNEKLGFVGRGEGIAAEAIALLASREETD